MLFTFTKPKSKLTWLITGCSSGFGLTLTRLALAGGHTVIATSRSPSRTPSLVAEVESQGGKWLALDVSDPRSGAIVEELEQSGAEIDVLVNNAGYSIFSPIETCTEEELRGQMECMYLGPLRLIRAVVPHMRRRRYGVIVNFSTGAALAGRDTMGAYAGAKAGLDGITRVLAKEVAPYNIRALTVILGAFNTEMAIHTAVGKNPLPDDYKGSVSDQMFQFLTSPQSSLPGGQTGMGDRNKAMQAVYEVVIGEGVGAGLEAEQILPLGTDMTARVKGVIESYAHALEAFEHVTLSLTMLPLTNYELRAKYRRRDNYILKNFLEFLLYKLPNCSKSTYGVLTPEERQDRALTAMVNVQDPFSPTPKRYKHHVLSPSDIRA
ncbi:hypothetical protein F4781DRAFT_445389 [Annulohypoxylon bovei var. microspora]|nr:hypothetical protein F4781DRAFT_445389 [Annulohypoxylon bovei var. microspora]